MKVLIIRNAYQKDTGGAEQYAYNFGLALKNAGLYPIVVTKHKAILDKCRVSDIETINGIWSENQGWSKFYYLRALYTTLWYVWTILIKKIDIVQPQSRDDFVFATWAGKILNKPVFWTDHGDLKILLDRKKHPHPRMQKWLFGSAAYASKIICVSDSEKENIIAVSDEVKNKLIVVRNGVFIPHPTKTIDKPLPVIGAISRLVPDKGISEIIESFAKLKSFKGQLWLVGSPSGNGAKYKDLAKKLGVEKRVVFVGYVNNSDDYLCQMDYFVHASYHEAFGIAIAEACMAGLPIVATNVGGIPEIISDGETGLLVEARNSDALTASLNLLLNNPELARVLGKNASKMAEKKFDFQKIVEKEILPLYNIKR